MAKHAQVLESATPNKRRCIRDGMPDLSKAPIAITVGTSVTETFHLYQHALEQHSEFFATSLKQVWKEGKERTVKLPEERPERFAIFAHFVHSGRVPTAVEAESDDTEKARTRRLDAEVSLLRDCWVMGNRLLSDTFKDAVTDTLIDVILESSLYPISLHQILYARTAGPGGLRRLVVDIAVWGWQNERISDRPLDAAWMEFFRDLAKRLHEVNTEKRSDHTKAPFWKDSCLYHEHGAEKRCYKELAW